MKRLPVSSGFLLAACLLSMPASLLAQTAQQREEVKTFLTNWKKTNLISDTDIQNFKTHLGKQALPLLAEYLPDKELGFLAQMAMDQIDSIGSTPYKLKNLVNNDPNQQRDTFRIANNALKDYALFVRAGQPAADPNKPAPRYPPNNKPYPYVKELHDAAVAELNGVLAKEPIGAEREAIETVGLTGTKADLPLLTRYAAKYGPDPFVVAAQARLGDATALQQIAAVLKEPAKTIPAAPVHDDHGGVHPPQPGQRVTELESGQRLRTAMEQAGYTMDRRFVPLLLAHLDDLPGQFHGDYSDPSPQYYAQEALSRIVFGKPLIGWTPSEWHAWAKEHPKEAAGK